jgi:hypothetical protein
LEVTARWDLSKIVSNFQLEGDFVEAIPYGSGHINDTFASRFQVGSNIVHYLHQRINHNIFKEPEKLMENIERVTSYAREQVVAAGGDPWRETLNLIPTMDDESFHLSPEGDYWRTYVFIENARTYDQVEDLRHVYSAAKAFGNFQKMLSSLPGGRLHETIPNFHHTRKRFEAFVEALDNDIMNRACYIRDEIDFVLARESDTSIIVDMLESGEIPERVTHNDTKLNNVMIDDETGEGICVIDLDTVMPGSALYDFGDSVRIGASTAAEDERDLSKVGVSMDMFDRLSHGYLDAARDFLTPTEMDYMAFSARLMTFECGMRFLTDHLVGDTYFKIHRENHNLDRSRTQFKMVAEMEEKSDRMEAIIARYRQA